MATTLTELLTADDLLRLYNEGVRGELIRGVLHETMPTGVEHGEIAVNLSAELRNFVKPRRLGRLVTSDVGVWLERGPGHRARAGHRLLLSGEHTAGRAVYGVRRGGA